jgi:regulator of protease activity HflC (stomatin/prohibitin superfamily)
MAAAQPGRPSGPRRRFSLRPPSPRALLGWGLGVALVAAAVLVARRPPVVTVAPSELVVRHNLWSGESTAARVGWLLVVPGVHHVARFSLSDQLYRPARSAAAAGEAPYQSLEGLGFGLDLSIRYALEPTRIATLPVPPERVSVELVEPQIDGVVRRVFARHTVREIYSSQRQAVEDEISATLAPLLVRDGVVLKGVQVGSVDLPGEYRQGLEQLLAEELASEKMRYTLELRAKSIKEAELVAEADKVRREKDAEAAGQTEIIAARSRAEAMRHVLPFKEKEIEQRRLEAEASKISRIKAAEGDAEARRIEAAGEADSRRTIASSEAYRAEALAKVASEALARDSVLIASNPLLIQKTVADKLSDKISVVIAPPESGGFFAAQLLGRTPAPAPVAVTRAPVTEERATEGVAEGEAP